MKRFILLYLLINVSNIFAAKELLITPAFQDSTLWCWAASCEMVLDAYGELEDQYDCAIFAVGGKNKMVDMTGKNNAVDR